MIVVIKPNATRLEVVHSHIQCIMLESNQTLSIVRGFSQIKFQSPNRNRKNLVRIGWTEKKLKTNENEYDKRVRRRMDHPKPTNNILSTHHTNYRKHQSVINSREDNYNIVVFEYTSHFKF